LVGRIICKAAFRGKGIGSEALELFENTAREQVVSVIHLEVNHVNPALELYRKLGFEDHQRYLMSKWLVNSA